MHSITLCIHSVEKNKMYKTIVGLIVGNKGSGNQALKQHWYEDNKSLHTGLFPPNNDKGHIYSL